MPRRSRQATQERQVRRGHRTREKSVGDHPGPEQHAAGRQPVPDPVAELLVDGNRFIARQKDEDRTQAPPMSHVAPSRRPSHLRDRQKQQSTTEQRRGREPGADRLLPTRREVASQHAQEAHQRALIPIRKGTGQLARDAGRGEEHGCHEQHPQHPARGEALPQSFDRDERRIRVWRDLLVPLVWGWNCRDQGRRLRRRKSNESRHVRSVLTSAMPGPAMRKLR